MDGKTILDEGFRKFSMQSERSDWHSFIIHEIDAALAAARAEEREALKCCVEFTRLALERWDETECMMDGADVQEVLQESGVLVETTYDPAIHGEQDAEPGDPWMVFSPAWNAIRARTQP